MADDTGFQNPPLGKEVGFAVDDEVRARPTRPTRWAPSAVAEPRISGSHAFRAAAASIFRSSSPRALSFPRSSFLASSIR